MHPKPCQASKFPVALVWCLSHRDPNLLRAIHGMNNILKHPNRLVPSIYSPPHDMSHHLAILLLFKYVVVALLLVLVGGLGVHVWRLQVWRCVFLDLLSLLVSLLAFVQVLGLAIFFALCLALFLLALVGLVAFFATLEASHGFSLLKLLHARGGVILRRLDLLLSVLSFEPPQVRHKPFYLLFKLIIFLSNEIITSF